MSQSNLIVFKYSDLTEKQFDALCGCVSVIQSGDYLFVPDDQREFIPAGIPIDRNLQLNL